ncbi:lytic transglycosylase domain-containing protein [Cupriavidus sp. D39]|uniref:lytic transglycosylase domain-containing protein n=1 Tax=Cupriavidus sp. D39 TaxID=2997877 RepID=UPI0022722A94|nr:lytic transglycosylase domain-containing protein [Cupriavidus sp. D39]MCY0853058.1 lytic transglycosylase domain-containing protein [Cupriavidus sp. D39]
MRFLVGALTLFIATLCHGEDLQSLMARCVPEVHPTTMAAIVRVETGGNMFAISDDGPAGLPWSERKKLIRSFRPSTLEEAVQISRDLAEKGHWFGIGLTQLSNRHLSKLGLSVEQALDLCTNLKSGGKVLLEFFAAAKKKYANENDALQAAISAYNTGNFESGFANGYVQKVVSAARLTVPALRTGGTVSAVRVRAAGVSAGARGDDG